MKEDKQPIEWGVCFFRYYIMEQWPVVPLGNYCFFSFRFQENKSFGAQPLALILCQYVADIAWGTVPSKEKWVWLWYESDSLCQFLSLLGQPWLCCVSSTQWIYTANIVTACDLVVFMTMRSKTYEYFFISPRFCFLSKRSPWCCVQQWVNQDTKFPTFRRIRVISETIWKRESPTQEDLKNIQMLKILRGFPFIYINIYDCMILEWWYNLHVGI
jgi:hypothetical protein